MSTTRTSKFIVTLEAEIEAATPEEAARIFDTNLMGGRGRSIGLAVTVVIADDPDLADWTINLDEEEDE